ncbi:DHA2 family efflux MFS transporter permease subunit [bacterium]|nr:DHA2 family efflux MFS transporter permease subunit [bacterium]
MENGIAQEGQKPLVSPWLITIPLVTAAFLFALNETIANVALPYIAGTISISRNESTWIVTSYLVASSVVIPAIGYFCRVFGRKRYFIFSILLFTIASLMCGLSRSMPMVILSRFLQGIGGGAILPLVQAIMMEIFPQEEWGKAMSLYGFAFVIAPILGPVIGGWLTENWSWPWIFLINAPIGLVCAISLSKLIKDPPYAKKQKGAKMDFFGFGMLVIWILLLQIVLDKGNDAGWFDASWICWLMGISTSAGIIFFYTQFKNKKDPLLNLRLLKDLNFLFGTLIQMVLLFVLIASAMLLPSMLQGLLGYTAFLGGVSMLPRGLGSLAGLLILVIFTGKVPEKISCLIGLILIGMGGFLFGLLNMQISLSNIFIPNFLYGVGMVMSMTPVINLSCATLKKEDLTMGSSLQNLMKNLGASFGTSIATTCISRYSQVHQNMMVGYLNDLNPVFSQRVQEAANYMAQYTDYSTAHYMALKQMHFSLLEQSTLWAFIDTFRIFALASFIIIPLLLLMKEKTKKNI